MRRGVARSGGVVRAEGRAAGGGAGGLSRDYWFVLPVSPVPVSPPTLPLPPVSLSSPAPGRSGRASSGAFVVGSESWSTSSGVLVMGLIQLLRRSRGHPGDTPAKSRDTRW